MIQLVQFPYLFTTSTPTRLDIQNKTYIEEHTELQRAIFKNYDRGVRPKRDRSQSTMTSIHIHLMHFSVQERKQSILVYGHLYMVSVFVVRENRRGPSVFSLGTTNSQFGILPNTITSRLLSSINGIFGSQTWKWQTGKQDVNTWRNQQTF